MKVPIADHLRTHLMASKAQNFNNFIKTATAWRTVLKDCSPIDPASQELAELVREVDAFIGWSKAGLAELELLALQEVVTDGIDQLFKGNGSPLNQPQKPPKPPAEG